MDRLNFRLIVLALLPLVMLTTSHVVMRGQTAEDFQLVIRSLNMTNVMNHVRYLSNLPNQSCPSRFTGYPGFYQAAEYIKEMLTSYGYNVREEPFTVTVPFDLGANVTVMDEGGRVLRVFKAYPLLPNDVATCVTPPEGVEGKLIYAKAGELIDFNDKVVKDSIVLLDFDSRNYWKNAIMLGAKAVVFIGSPLTSRVESEMKLLKIPVNFPRLYIPPEDGLVLKEFSNFNLRAKVVSRMEWKNIQVSNILAEAVGQSLPTEKIVVAAYYDSYSPVPSISPGATDALNVALLLELAKFFGSNSPSRNVIFAFLAGHYQGLWGAREFVSLHFSQVGMIQKLFIGLDLSDDTNYIAVYARGNTYQYATSIESTRHSWISNVIESNKRLYEATAGEPVNFINAIFPSTPFFDAAALLFDSDPFTLAGGVGITFHTTNSLRSKQLTPTDTWDKIRFDSLPQQLRFVAANVYNFANRPALQTPGAPTRIASDWGFASLRVAVGEYNLTKAFYDPFEHPDSIIHIQWPQSSPFASRGYTPATVGTFDIYIKPTEDGGILGPGLESFKNVSALVQGVKPYSTIKVEAYVINKTTGNVEYATDLGIYGLGRGYPVAPQGANVWINQEVVLCWIPLFRAGSIVLLNVIDPTTSTATPFSIQNFYLRSHSWHLKHGEDIFETDAVAFVRPDFPTELIITYGGAGAGAVGGQGVTSSGAGRGESARYPLAILANFSEGFPEGRGYSVAAGEQLIIYNTPLELARQLLFVTSQRVELMATFHTKNMVIEQFYPLAVTSLKVADTALSNRQYDEAIANAIRAWSYIRSAYIGTMSLIMDVITTVVFFFLLLIPFGYLTQMLILPKLQGAMKLMGLIAIVLICIAILAAFHPGFYIATNVYMIILAVAVAVIGLTVVSKTLGEALASAGAHREKLLGAHMISYSKTAALALSFSVGIENMRKRKLRTSLTLISLIIMTTALVVLTSASVYMYLSSSKMEGPISYQGLLVRDPNFSPQAELMKDVLRGLYKTEGLVAPRTWVAQPQGFLLAPGISIKAVFGLTPTEESLTNVSKALVKGRWLSETDRTTCLLSESLARKLDVDIGGQVRWLGLNLSVIGILDDAKMTNVKDLDMLRLAPVIFVEGALTTLAPSEFIIVPYDLLMSNYATTPYSIAVKLNDEKTVMPIAQQLALQTQRLNVYAGVRGEVVVLTTQSWYGVTGASMLTVPVILTALTVLNVIIGSVYERMKEITVYTVVGLTPTHISGLFISESVLFAVVSAVGGYLIAMSILGLMDLLHLILPGQFINYASTFVIVAVVSTMLTAILASLYPALKASRLAIPSLERKWRIPTSPTQDYWFIPLPFMATFEEVGGVISYLKEYIDASTKAFGAFVSEGSEVAITPNRIALSFVARLAPYDLGIMQKTSITALAETSRKIKSSTFNFAIEVYRRSGHRDSWILSNRVFIDLIRKQFLYWRALPPSRKGEYIKAFSKMTQERFQDEAGGEIGA